MPATKVSNEFPTLPHHTRLAIIGEAPGTHEVAIGRPFVGSSGQLLTAALQQAGIPRSACFIGNVCQLQPPNNDIESFDKSSWEIQDGLKQLSADLNKFQPHCCLLLGATALWAAGITHSVSSFRGSIFSPTTSHFRSFKSVASFHPSAVLRNWDYAPLFNFDVSRAAEEAKTPELILPKRKIRATMTPSECIAALEAIKPGTLVSIDIEGGVPDPTATTHKHLDGVTCVAVSTDPLEAFIIPFKQFDVQNLTAVMRAFAKVMADEEIPKVLQNSMYDFFVLAWLWKFPIRNIQHDTMISGWELYPELPKALGVQASIYTREPYYKFERKIEDDRVHFEYCCKDAAVTLEIHQAHMREMSPPQREHYEFNMKLIPALQFMALRGILYDTPNAKVRHAEIEARMYELQSNCNSIAGKAVNLNSPKQLAELLYKQRGLPPQYKIEEGKRTNKLTTDADALLKCFLQSNDPFLSNLLAWKKLEGVRKQLEITTDHDSRMRCNYNLVGAETGRLSCSGSNSGSGTNLQTITKQLRKYYIADPGYHFFQLDLSGADGWTVAAHAAALGDPTMMDDYLAGLKPAKIIAVMHLQGASVSKLSRAELKSLIKSTPIPSALYDVCKVVQHGSNYGMGKNRMADQVLEKSFKKSDELNLITASPKDCEALQSLYFIRYPGILSWQRWVEQKIKTTNQLPCASGHVRTFFGRPGDKQAIKAAWAHEPQANTTYVTNLALLNLWQDPENRRPDGSLIIEPLHSVHDALCGQFPQHLTEWAVKKIRGYFDNPIRIANQIITIPYEGGYGPSWYHTGEETRLGEI